MGFDRKATGFGSRSGQVKKEDLWAGIVIALTAGLICLGAARYLPFFRVAESWVYDLRVAALAPVMPQSREVIIVTIIEETLATLPYRSPLDRRFLSALLRDLEAKEVRLIGLDILLDQPTEPDKDRELRDTLHSLSVPIVVAWADEHDGLTESQSAFLEQYLEGIDRGTANVIRDADDGTVRDIYLGTDPGNERLPALVVALAKAVGVAAPRARSMAVDYRSGPDRDTPPFSAFPSHTLEFLPAAWFAGKIVLVGADLALADRHRTPFAALRRSSEAQMPGVMVHAHALSQLLEMRSLQRLPAWQNALVILIASSFGLMLAAVNVPLLLRSTLGLIAVGLSWVAGFLLFQQGGPLVPLVAPTVAFGASVGVAHAYFRQRERAQRKFIRGAFDKYLAPAVIDQLEADPSLLRLSGEQRELTFLFSDIAGFTPLTERLEPEMLVTLLNAYLGEGFAIVLEHGGTIDKVVGDALHVMFNAPQDQPDHAERAVKCALALDVFSQAFIAKQAKDGIEFGHTRIGVNTGLTTIGNFGGEAHFDYTAHGAAINTAARLESANKHFGTRLCVSEFTKRQCAGIHFRPIGRVGLVGISEPIALFEPLHDSEAKSERVLRYAEAFELLVAGDSAAAGRFSDLLGIYPDDSLVALHAGRLASGGEGDLIILKGK